MTFTETIVSLIIIGLFAAGVSQIIMPIYKTQNKIINEYRTINAIDFICQSFKQECLKSNRDINKWKIMAGSINELENCAVTELRQSGILRALKLTCVISGENIEVLGVCTP